MHKQAVLLVNLGSPETTEVSSVRKYLREFLMDKNVIDIPVLQRNLVVKGFILPTRPANTAMAYKKIWTEEGSPLIVLSKVVQKKLQATTNLPVYMAMRYAQPSIKKILQKIKQNENADDVFVMPLYPHYAMSSYKSVEEKVQIEAKKVRLNAQLHFLQPFYNEALYIKALSTSIQKTLDEQHPDFLLFSYHGVPERQIKKTDPTGQHCLQAENCCFVDSPAHKYCYRHQCFTTTRLVVNRLNLKKSFYSIAFQSRLGRTPWLQPFTDKVLVDLAKKGIKKVAVVCPSFVSDCLETLEEIAIRGRDDFINAGGKELYQIPCINTEDNWIECLQYYIEKWQTNNPIR